jgi:hypothetical protein
MALKFAGSIFATNLVIGLFSCPAMAGCGDRPGTPTNVTANPVFGVFGMVRVEWTNTASEEVWWDYDVTHNGARVQSVRYLDVSECALPQETAVEGVTNARNDCGDPNQK